MSMDNTAEALRRWWGAFCLAMAAGMLIWGQTVLKPVLAGGWFLCYWIFCLGFTLGAIVIALVDVRAVRRRVKAEHRELLQRAIDELAAEEQENSSHPRK